MPAAANAGIRKKILDSGYPEFYKKVWLECLNIPCGKTSTYSEIAANIGNPRAQRAVGNALNKNPFAPEVPCHRVIRKNGGIGGYAGGAARKIELLKKEAERARTRQKARPGKRAASPGERHKP